MRLKHRDFVCFKENLIPRARWYVTNVSLPQIGIQQQTKVRTPSKSDLVNNEFYWGYLQEYGWGVSGAEMTQGQYGWQLRRTGKPEAHCIACRELPTWLVFPFSGILSGLSFFLLWETYLQLSIIPSERDSQIFLSWQGNLSFRDFPKLYSVVNLPTQGASHPLRMECFNLEEKFHTITFIISLLSCL